MAKVRVDHTAAALVHLACGAEELAHHPLLRETADRICARLLDRVVGDRSPSASARWAQRDPVVARLLFDTACALGATLFVRHAARSELVLGRVAARTDPEGRSGVLIAVQTSAPPARTGVLCGEVCRRLLAGEPVGRAGARLRGLGQGTELQGSYRFAVGT